ncbi:MAG: RHS repeat-associated core domain-containing protein, partial [Oscillospiraceae bacterium]|nr:RHS repeat-associated core domain-containing protein [Oscillospiraceae bacterium]
DKLSRKIAEYAPNYSADKSHGTLTSYYPDDNKKTETDAEGNVTSYKYDAYGNVTEKTNPDETVNVTEYDGLQREKATYFKSKAESDKQILTSTDYEFVRNHGFDVYTALNSSSSKSCSGLKTIKKTYITADKQVVNETLADWKENTVYEKTNGETKRTSAYYANGQLARQTDALGNTTKYEYGTLNKLTKTYTPFNGKEKYSVTENQYDKNGNVILTKQTVQKEDSSTAKYSITQNEYNGLGLLSKVTLSGTGSNEKNITQYFYNHDGIETEMRTGLSSDTDTSYLKTEYVYDSRNHLVRTKDSTGYSSGTIAYDLNGNILTNTDSNGNVTTNTYDALNRVLKADTVNAKDSAKNVRKSYKYDSMGRITETETNELKATCIYDKLGRKYTEGESNKSGYAVFRGYFYEGVSQYVSQELTGIYHLLFYSDKTYEYDAEMRVVRVKESGEETVTYTYDANGNKKSETLANGVVSAYTYNNNNKVTGITNRNGNSTISGYEYSYYLDGSDACKIRKENGIIEKTSYEYDGLKRLTEESVRVGNNTTESYSYEYDDYGNRSKMTATGTEDYVTEYSYNNAQGKYTALLQKEVKKVQKENPLDLTSNVKQTVYTYDSNGNQIKKTAEGKTETYTYDGLNQLIGYTDGETTASYEYNLNGLRYEKTVDGQTINHVWDGNQQVIADVIDNQFYEADCYIRGTNLVAKYNFWNGKKSAYTYYTQNAHGDVVNLTDKDGKVTKSYKYDAFGVEKNIDKNDTNAFRYCGEYYDTESGTIYLRARYYDPAIGRFISRDTVTGNNIDPLSLNLYTYCLNNPVN